VILIKSRFVTALVDFKQFPSDSNQFIYYENNYQFIYDRLYKNCMQRHNKSTSHRCHQQQLNNWCLQLKTCWCWKQTSMDASDDW